MRLSKLSVTLQFGKLWLKYVREEAVKDAALGTGVPASESFLASFSVRRTLDGVYVVSSWPNIRAIMEGRRPYPLKWLVRSEGVTVVPMENRWGQTEFRMAPKTADRAWIHPGVKAHTFVQRALDRALEASASNLLDAVLGCRRQ